MDLKIRWMIMKNNKLMKLKEREINKGWKKIVIMILKNYINYNIFFFKEDFISFDDNNEMLGLEEENRRVLLSGIVNEYDRKKK